LIDEEMIDALPFVVRQPGDFRVLLRHAFRRVPIMINETSAFPNALS